MEIIPPQQIPVARRGREHNLTLDYLEQFSRWCGADECRFSLRENGYEPKGPPINQQENCDSVQGGCLIGGGHGSD